MEKNNNGKVIAVIALVVAVVGLSLGFAAYSTYLRVEGAATVETGTGNWSVGFSTNGSTIEPLNGTNTVTGVNATTGATQAQAGSVTVSKYTISQATSPVLKPTEGSQVSYTLDVLNLGSLDAYLDAVTFGATPLTCSYVETTGNGTDEWVDYENNSTTPYAGTKRNNTGSNTIDCDALFSVSLSINGTTYTPTNSSANGAKLDKTSGDHEVVLTLAYKNDAAAIAEAANLEGDINVTIAPIGIVYTSTNPNG